MMGVMMCSRGNCENIMCDRYSQIYGYICNECFKELVRKGAGSDIQEFMNSPKSFGGSGNASTYFDTVFPFYEWTTDD